MSLDRNDHFIFQMTIWYTIGLISLFLQISFYTFREWYQHLDFCVIVSLLDFDLNFFSGTIKYVWNSSIHFFSPWRLLGRVHWWSHMNTGNFDGEHFKLLAQLPHWIWNYPSFLFLCVNFDFFKKLFLCIARFLVMHLGGTFRIVHTWASSHFSHSHISSHTQNLTFFSSLYFIIHV